MLRKTFVSISDFINTDNTVHPANRRESRIILHDGWQWVIGRIHDEEELEEMLDYLEMKITTVESQKKIKGAGNVIFYNLSKRINNACGGGFKSLDEVLQLAKMNGEKLKPIKALSNGSIVDCFVGIGEKVVNIYRPNPNYSVYKPFPSVATEIEYRNSHWYL